VDLKELEGKHLDLKDDGSIWIITHSRKTGTRSAIPLLPQAQAILNTYVHTVQERNGMLLPVISNQKMNAYLKEIGEICGIEKNLTFHLARHTFATSITLTNGVPIGTVSKMLGHTSLKTTQIYAKVVDTKILEDMKVLAAKLGNG
jgi:site-specific recombinase XerD